MNYKEQIKTPEWQRKRTEIFNRDNFQCQICFDRKTQLAVHHKFYTYGSLIYEYDNDNLITVCSTCHKKLHDSEISINFHYDVDFCETFAITYTDFFMLKQRFLQLKQQQGTVWIKTVMQLITAQIIKKGEM